MNNIWIFKEEADERTIDILEKKLEIPRSLANVLVSRGIRTIEQARAFFDFDTRGINDPFLMHDMQKAVDRLLLAVKNHELVWVHGDYDVDGTSSTAMMTQFLREIGGSAEYYIPDRFLEGYGLSVYSMDKAKAAGATIVVSVDVGITSIEPLKYAKEIGIDTIVCDHHEPCSDVPDAFAILDPLKPGCNYPFKYLAATGVTFKLVQAMATTIGKPELAHKYLDYVAIASAADMVPLVGENRIMTKMGLDIINSKPRPGLKGLIDCTGMKMGCINTSSIIYGLAPLINAAGRLGDAKRSVKMMLQSDPVDAFRIAQKLERENIRRRAIDEQTFEETIQMADKIIAEEETRGLVLHAPHWHAGVIGIVASRLVDRYHMPTVLLTSIDHVAKGSARSPSNYDIHAALKSCEYLLDEYGGHKHAAGLSLQENKVAEFRRQFNRLAIEKLSKTTTTPEIVIDAELKLNELSPTFIAMLQKFAPFGYENHKPYFYSKGVTLANGVKVVGSNHLKFRAYQSHFVIDAIGYNLGHKIDVCSGGKPFSIVYNIEESNYNGHSIIQLRIKDLRNENE
ncbi:MAG: single-stranded-DNA-specific exonuclease RecJ [Candidatus Kapabacteria bacterium]|nr:single-stranded-DNA-specific exonuclease RecJ [Candidatus Kapabacteria bacterium]